VTLWPLHVHALILPLFVLLGQMYLVWIAIMFVPLIRLGNGARRTPQPLNEGLQVEPC
jgi:hypothetical protein